MADVSPRQPTGQEETTPRLDLTRLDLIALQEGILKARAQDGDESSGRSPPDGEAGAERSRSSTPGSDFKSSSQTSSGSSVSIRLVGHKKETTVSRPCLSSIRFLRSKGLPSIGSLQHDPECCKNICRFENLNQHLARPGKYPACVKGSLCDFCHCAHPRGKRCRAGAREQRSRQIKANHALRLAMATAGPQGDGSQSDDDVGDPTEPCRYASSRGQPNYPSTSSGQARSSDAMPFPQRLSRSRVLLSL